MISIFTELNCQVETEVIYLQELKDEYVFRDYLEILEDKDCQFVIEEISQREAERPFLKFDEDYITSTERCYWLRFSLQSDSGFQHYFKNWKLFIGEADYAEVYVLDSVGEVTQKKTTGNWYPLSQKEEEIEGKEQRVTLSFNPTQKLHFYIKYQRKDHHGHKIDLRLKKYDFYQSIPYLYDSWQNWLFLGFVLTMLLFNFIFYASTRFIAFLYHGLFISGMVILTLNFFDITSNLYYIQDHPYLVQLVTVTGVALADIAYFQFIRHYLSLKEIMPKWDKVLSTLVQIKIAFWPLIMVYYYQSFNEPLTDKIILAFLVVQYLVVWSFLVYLLRIKHKNSLWLVLGNGFLILLIFINLFSLLNSTGISSAYTQLGVGGEILCFSLGLAFRFRDLRKEEQETVRLKELSKFKSKVLSNITHEFRTPLTIIQGASDLFRESLTTKVSNYDLNKAYNALERNSANLLNLINQMLDLAKLENKHIKIDYQVIDMVELLSDIVHSFQANSSSKNLNIAFHSTEEELFMNTDREKVRVIVSNLISNAVKFTPEGGSVNLDLSKNSLEKRVIIKVSDTGIGMSSLHLEHIFDRFYQVENTEDTSIGTGIGLSMVKELVELLNGEITVESEERAGTNFTIVLPNEEVETEIEEETQASLVKEKMVLGESPIFEKEKPILLIVEDNEDIQDYLQMLLSKDYSLKIASDGLEGLNFAKDIIPDIIISDLMMPKMDGIRMCDQLKQDTKTSHIPIIILTAKTEFEDRMAGLETGADAYLTKPFRKKELFIRLRKLNESRKVLQKKYSQFSLINKPKDLKKENSFIHKVNSIIEENLTNDQFGVEDLSSSLHMSRMQLYRKLKAVSDRSASNYIRSFRLYKAKPLILDKEKSISEIAWEVGFQDANYFSKSFQKEFGSTPTEYRKSLQ